jgi:hypothetical protein
MFPWIMILIFLGLGWRLGRPEIELLKQKWSRRYRWVGALQPSLRAVKLYEDPQDIDRLKSHLELSQHFIKLFEESSKRVISHRQSSAPVIDIRLCHIAKWITESLVRGQKVPQSSLIRYLSSHFGISAPIPFIIHLRQSMYEDHTGLLFKYEDSLNEAISLGAPRLTVGFAELIHEEERIMVALIQPQYLSINPFSRHVVGDMGLIIHGESLEMLPLEAWMTRPDGTAQSVPLQRNGSYFSLQLKDRERGSYQIELMGESAQGPVVCLNAVIYRSVNPPQEFILTEGVAPSKIAWFNRKRLYQLINDSRKLVGQKGLPSSRVLQGIAQEYAQEMASFGFASHTSPKGERLNHRTEPLKDRAERIFENLAVGVTVDEIHEQLMSSPAHRAAVLDPEVTHVGVGMCMNKHLIFGVEVFSLMNRPLRLTEDRAELYRVIQRYRREEGQGRLPHESELEKAALSVARSLVSGECKPHEVNQHAQHCLERSQHPDTLGVIEVYVCQVNRVESLPKSEVWLQDQVKSFGIGLAQGAAHEPYWVVSVLRLQDQGQKSGLNLLENL